MTPIPLYRVILARITSSIRAGDMCGVLTPLSHCWVTERVTRFTVYPNEVGMPVTLSPLSPAYMPPRAPANGQFCQSSRWRISFCNAHFGAPGLWEFNGLTGSSAPNRAV